MHTSDAGFQRHHRWRRRLLILVILVALLGAAGAARCWYGCRDRHPGYNLRVELGHTAEAKLANLRAGFSRLRLNPDLSDRERPIWLAGFANHRAATRLHDDLWAIACVLDDGQRRLGIVSLDAIGLFHDDVIEVRSKLAPSTRLDYSIVCCTHNHSTPDLLGLWGPNHLRTGVDQRYRQQVISAAATALDQAARSLQAARVGFHHIVCAPDGLVADARKPKVFDPDIRVMHFTDSTSGVTLGTIVGWANHPETVWGENTEVTADFPGYLREALESGLREDARILNAGLGGTHLYINGAIGGLMTPNPSLTVHDPLLDADFKTPSHNKARALGRQVASRILGRLHEKGEPGTNRIALGIRARTIEIPVENRIFLLASALGLVDRGHVRWRTMRTEVAVVTFGEASVACIPGEIYPEIVNGGIDHASSADYPAGPEETPPIREFMPGKYKFIFGLANDEIGYLIPKTQWDRKAPYAYGARRAAYGEINSLGSDAAGRIHRALRELCGP